MIAPFYDRVYPNLFREDLYTVHFMEMIARILSLDCAYSKIKNDIHRLLHGNKTEFELGTLKEHMSDEQYKYYQDEIVGKEEIDEEAESEKIKNKFNADFFKKKVGDKNE